MGSSRGSDDESDAEQQIAHKKRAISSDNESSDAESSKESEPEVTREENDDEDEDRSEARKERAASSASEKSDEEEDAKSDKSGDEEVERSEKGSDDEEEGEQPSKASDAKTTKEIFGSDMSSEDEEDDDKRKEADKSQEEEEGSQSSPPARSQRSEDRSEDEGSRHSSGDRRVAVDEQNRDYERPERRDYERAEYGEEEQEEAEPQPPPEIRIEADIPRMVANLGSELYFVKFPNFLSVETHPYDPQTYEDEYDDEDVDGEGRVKLKVENTLRWRNVPDADGRVQHESNARIVQWSDGSLSLHLGSEIFDIHKHQLLAGENNHLFVRQGIGLHGQAVFRTKLSFRPYSTDSFTHRKMTLSLADKSQKTHKVRLLPDVGADPEAHRAEMIKKEEERLKASIRRENKVKRIRERATSRGPSAAYLEDRYEDEDEEGAISLSAIKYRYKKRDFSSASAAYSDSDDGSDLDIGKKARRAKVEESDED